MRDRLPKITEEDEGESGKEIGLGGGVANVPAEGTASSGWQR